MGDGGEAGQSRHPMSRLSASVQPSQGFANAVWLACRLRPGGGGHFGVLCSSFVRISSGTTGRSKGFPVGRKHITSVRDSNIMATRVALIMVLLISTGMLITIEQPASSVLEFQPSLQKVFEMASFYRISFAMWNFGHHTWKPTLVYSNREWLTDMLDYWQDRKEDFTN